MSQPVNYTPSDVVAAIGSPVAVATITLADCNTFVAFVGGVLGIVYLLWKWRREARKPDSLPPFPTRKR